LIVKRCLDLLSERGVKGGGVLCLLTLDAWLVGGSEVDRGRA
jgi:hypothetical protein